MSNSEASPDLRAGIVTATTIALQLAQSASQDTTLGGEANNRAISTAWYQVLQALRDAPTPDPDVEGSVAEWERQKPIIQGMANLIKQAEEDLRTQKAGDICQQLQQDLQMAMTRLHWNPAGAAPSEINYSRAPLDLSGALEASEYAAGKAAAGRPRGEPIFARAEPVPPICFTAEQDYENGKAAAQSRQSGGR